MGIDSDAQKSFEGGACPDCGQSIPSGGLSGMCPVCLLRQGAAGDTAGGAPFTPPALEDLARLFPHLEILGLIGTGGMGAVYKARQRELDRVVALKILPPGIDDRPGFAERFTREARALAKLNHSGIVAIHDTGRVEGLYYLLMEYVDGLNLRQLLQDKQISYREALAIVPMICDALQYAHDAGVVHRDIKPENILLDKQGRVKVADFGLAKLVGISEMDMPHAPSTAPYLTEAGQVMGTPQYMAPEQIAHPSDVDHRADIYSLGIVFYQMLTGELPGRVLEPPSKKAEVDVRLDEVVRRALEMKPEDRYQRASEVKMCVETIIASPASGQTKEDQSMDIAFRCPSCDQKLSVDSSAAGTAVNCPSCTQAIIVPSVTPPPPMQIPPPPRPAAPPPPRPVPSAHQMAYHPMMATKSQAVSWAIWAMILGLIGLVPMLGLATGLLGLVFGIVALVKDTSKKGLAITGVVAGGLACLLIPFHVNLLKVTIAGAKFGAQTVVCSQNLTDIGRSISAYQARHGGQYPPNLQVLVKEGLLAEKSLTCPVENQKGRKGGYGYRRPQGTSGTVLIAWDLVPHSMGKNAVAGRNVLDSALNVRFVEEKNFSAELRAGASTSGTPHGSRSHTQNANRGQSQTSKLPVAPPPPVREEISIAIAAEKLKSAEPKEMRTLLQYLIDAEVDEKQRKDVMAAVKPLLNDVDHADMAFRAFAKWADKEHAPDLIRILESTPNSWKGKESMKILARMGDARAVDAIALCLKDFHMLRETKAALASMGEVAKPGVLPYYHSESGHARTAARELLKGFNATDAEIMEVSLKAISSTEAETRRSAVEYLGAATLADDKRPTVAAAVRGLILEEDPRVAEVARTALKKLATASDADFLLEQMDSTDSKNLKLATELLIQLKDARVAKALALQLADPKETYRAGNYLIQIGDSAENEVLPYLRSEDVATRRRAADVLAKIGTKASIPELEKAAKDSDFFARSAAASALGAIKGRSTENKGDR
jgi:serine/threonine protein kinase/HEAT repeat protein